ncbi:DNA-processing protein DprA [Lentilactobacillus kosonis]|uniref:Rossmann fold nucleotide-binding protein Smf n=1 Tax=Lentilactobacillus kosonis TaxID=2810561 RepID=A0A401FKX0_9LACO|nr:DNA-processing protein DprA [Lentilactobacillus kosonis]GAY73022.1 rossmann fold nucleotide-binding protein Smf [Lentilactobacillus kosonis]
MRLNDFLFLIKGSTGISLKNEVLLYQLVERFSESELDGLDGQEIANLLKLTPKMTAQFIPSFTKLQNQFIPELTDHWLAINDPCYPEPLREAYLPPIGLFYRGNLQLLQTKMLGVVGSRVPTDYSRTVLKQIIPELVCQKLTLVSGLAKGVDTITHRLTVANGGNTIAVIGTGLAQYYPSENRSMQDYIGSNHLLLSEYLSNVGPRRHHFPERNRIIAGLCQGVLVSEAKNHSGSLITANLALQNNREVFAIPGPINSPLSVGTNELILAGAKPVLQSNHIIEELLY